jgi:hypothetical protein
MEPTGSGLWNKVVPTYSTIQIIPHRKLKREVFLRLVLYVHLLYELGSSDLLKLNCC